MSTTREEVLKPHPIADTPGRFSVKTLGRVLARPHLALLLGIGLIISIGITRGELHFNGDEMRHGVTGIFFRDLLLDRPWSHPIQYTYEYYAKYPALGVAHWPPLFYLVEGIFFLLFGISAWVSRLVVLCFALLGAYFWYRIAEREGPQYRALISSIIFPLLPYVLLYERATMLEIPLVALCLGALHFWRSFLEKEKPRHLWLVAAFVAAALLTSQKAVFLPQFLLLHFLVERRFGLLRRWDVWVAAGASVVAVLPWYALTFGTVALTYERAIGQTFGHTIRWEHWFYYPLMLPPQIGMLLTVLAVAGMVWSLVFALRRHRFLLLWVLVTYVCFSLIQEKDQRHSMIWIPPMVYFALLAIEALLAHRRWALAASGGLALFFLCGALTYQRPKLGGIEPAAQFVVSLPESDVIYYQGNLNGNFIFYVRKFDPEKRRVVARDKQVVATKILRGFGTRELLDTPEEVLEFFRQWGIRYAVIENRYRIPHLAVVNQVLNSPEFEMIREFPLWSNNPASETQGLRVLVYRYKGEIRRSDRPVVIPMMTLREDIRADLSRLAGQPWPN